MKVSARVNAGGFRRVEELLSRARRRAIERLRAERDAAARAGDATQDEWSRTARGERRDGEPRRSR